MIEFVDAAQGGIVAAAVAVAMVSVKAMEILLGKFRKSDDRGFGSNEKAALYDIRRHCVNCDRVHTETDKNNIPMIHFPRHYGEEIHKIPGGLQNMQGELDKHTILLTDIRELLRDQRR